MEAINYTNNGENMQLPADAQIVKGVSGNACYLPAGIGVSEYDGGLSGEFFVSLWRKWDGLSDVVDRGIFSVKNLQVNFDVSTCKLYYVLAGVKTEIDIADDEGFNHWAFVYKRAEYFKIYKLGVEIYSTTAPDVAIDLTQGFKLGGGHTHATFDEVRYGRKILIPSEIMGLYKLVTTGTQIEQLSQVVAHTTPKYLGVTESIPLAKNVVIVKGERVGVVDSNVGDWVLMGANVDMWKTGVCYKWTGAGWGALQPETRFTEEYQACLLHICEIPELMANTGHYGALFAKVLVAQKAMIEELTTNQAFIEKLTTNQAFIKKLIAGRLRIDNDTNDPNNFEMKINENVGLVAKNNNEKIFEVNTNGDIYAKNAVFQKCIFEGDIFSGPLELSSTAPTSKKIIINKNETIKQLFSKYKTCSYICSTESGIIDIKKVSIWSSSGASPLYGTIQVWVSFPNPLPGGPDGYYKPQIAIIGSYAFEKFYLKLFIKNSIKEYVYTKITDITQTNHVASHNMHVGKILSDERIEKDTVLQSIAGAKTYKLKDLPTMSSSDKGVVWVDENNFLRIS